MRNWARYVGVLISVLSLVLNVDAATVEVGEGRDRTLEVGAKVGHAALSKEGVVDVALRGNSVLISALSPGRTALSLYGTDGSILKVMDIVVPAVHTGDGPSQEEVEAMLVSAEGKRIPTLKVDTIPGGRIRVTGEVLTQRDVSCLAKIEAAFGDGVTDLTEYSSDYIQVAADSIRREVANANIEVVPIGMTMFLSGIAYGTEEKLRVEEMAKALYRDTRSFIRVAPTRQDDLLLEKPLIQMECQLIEISTSAAKKLGIDWASFNPLNVSINYDPTAAFGSAGVVTLSSSALFESLIPQIQSGNAEILYKQNLVCQNGDTAKFHSGGSFWITAYLPGSEDITTEEVEYGFIMQIRPQVDKYGNISSAIEIELSNMGETVNGFPSLIKRSVTTSVNVKRDQTLSLAKLFGSTSTDGDSGMPGLSRIPIVGKLFGSEEHRSGEREVLVFITPRVVIPGSADNTKLRDSMENKLYMSDE